VEASIVFSVDGIKRDFLSFFPFYLLGSFTDFFGLAFDFIRFNSQILKK